MKNIKKVISVVFIVIIIVCSFGYILKAVPNLQAQRNTKLYENKTYNISLQYNEAWKLNPIYFEKYEGKNGFFQVSAYGGENLKIDEIVKDEINHTLKPYGSSPKTTELTIQGQEARLILPSADQEQEFNNQAELIVKYPKAITIDGGSYSYFILWADKYNIKEIAKTLRFIS